MLENVIGALTSNGGRDFAEILEALQAIGYVYGALTMDARHFLPQSRPRLFIVAVRKDAAIASGLVAGHPAAPWASPVLVRAQESLQLHIRKDWRWWNVPAPAVPHVGLAELIEEEPADVQWHAPEETKRFLATMSEANLEKVEHARASGKRTVGTIYRRTRMERGGKVCYAPRCGSTMSLAVFGRRGAGQAGSSSWWWKVSRRALGSCRRERRRG